MEGIPGKSPSIYLSTNLSVGPTLTDDTEWAAETFVCRIYNISTTDSVDTACHALFYKVKKAEALPPTSDALHFHLLTSTSTIKPWWWWNAHLGTTGNPSTRNLGLEAEWSRSLCPIPDACLEVIPCSCKTQCHTRRCKCRRNGIQCTALYYCRSINDQPAPIWILACRG